jgi:hypothetical protein
MRKQSLVLVAAMLISSASIFAQNLTDNHKISSISKQISEMLSDNSFTFEDTDLHAQVRFTLNNKNEIVIMSVDTESDMLESFVKSKLNYQGVQENNFVEGKMFTVLVSVTS